MTSTVHFSKVRQLSVDFQLIPTPSLDFQVAVNIGETVPLIRYIYNGFLVFSLAVFSMAWYKKRNIKAVSTKRCGYYHTTVLLPT